MTFLLIATEEVTKNWADYGLMGLVVGTLLLSLLWFIRHVVTVLIPNAEKTHGETVVKLAADHSASMAALTVELKESRQQFAQMVRDEREECQKRHVENTQVFKAMMDSLKELQRGTKI